MGGFVGIGMTPLFRAYSFPEMEFSTDSNVEIVTSVTKRKVNVS